MYSWAPRCSEAWSSRSVPARCMPPVSDAATGATKPRARNSTRRYLVMRRHPFRHRPGPVDTRPQGHGDEEGVIEEGQDPADDRFHRVGTRSEENTSEIQSLMRNSYAVFCLKKKM